MKKSDVYRLVRGAARLYHDFMGTDQCPKTIDFILWIGRFSQEKLEISRNNGNTSRFISPKLVEWLFILPLSVITKGKENCYANNFQPDFFEMFKWRYPKLNKLNILGTETTNTIRRRIKRSVLRKN